MATSSSFTLDLGTELPEFSLPDLVTGDAVMSRLLLARPVLVMFLCTHCPYVKHVEAELARLGTDYGRDVTILAIGSNDATAYPEDAPEGLRAQAERVGFDFPYLYDETQDVAAAFGAACTPDFFLFDAEHRLAYRGRLCASRPGSDVPVTGEDLRAALDAVIAGDTPSTDQKPSMGCGIKWKSENDPNSSDTYPV